MLGRRFGLVVSLLAGCAATPSPRTSAAPREAEQARNQIAAVLDDWHRAAAEADEARYFSRFTPDAVFLGTDRRERWTVDEFREFAHPYFAEGRAWTFRAARREIVLGPHGQIAWFDEDLRTENLGPARGSGVLVQRRGHWRIAHYNLALTIPNERVEEVRAMVKGCTDEGPRIVGHRGRGRDGPDNDWPENTIASMRQALREGAEMIELDVRLSADGVPVVIHDATVDRTTDGTGCVTRMTAEELQSLAVQGPQDERSDTGRAQVRIPTLAQVLASIDAPLNVELKVGNDDDADCPVAEPAAVARAVAEVLAHERERPRLVSSFDWDALGALHEEMPEVELGYLVETAEELQRAIDHDPDAVHPDACLATRARVEQLHEAGIDVNVWTVNDLETLRRMLELGVDGIITDEPARALRARRQWCGRPGGEQPK